ncbi:hypothetical protein RJ639_047351 [Escallonia herrerae]|uniref:CP12 domain-containing protein n=1 Tax=Escallonia herrerae TaxID=1293975 RepID=A0AA89ABN3_9ASTE|nr:hypothetical protein RJ639_026434 [Escallonia herrerae]KAK3022377.1 hypothetical protein RJ639_047351 [Escallonia herrerae]
MASLSLSNLKPNPTVSLNAREVRPAATSLYVGVKAMGGGGAKFKGTQMRERKLAEMIESKVVEAREVCGGDNKDSDGCRVAWDEVEEISQAKAHLRQKLEREEDPLESFCRGHPDNDECLVNYD